MAIKTSNGWRNTRLPVTQQAVDIFQKNTGLKVLAARSHTKGSMRPYVNLKIEYPYDKIIRNENGKNINGQKVDFISTSYKNERFLYVDVRWQALGMANPF